MSQLAQQMKQAAYQGATAAIADSSDNIINRLDGIEEKINQALKQDVGGLTPHGKLEHLKQFYRAIRVNDDKIEAIKQARTLTGAGLAESKEAVEWIIDRIG